jgi:ferredoxin
LTFSAAKANIVPSKQGVPDFMAKLIFDDSGEEKELPDDAPIAEACEEAGVPFACTEGVCGTCVIEIKEGKENLSSPTKEEEDFLGSSPCHERLACQCRIKHGTVRITF